VGGFPGALETLAHRGDGTKKAMRDGQKSKLIDKVLGGKASEEEKKTLLDLYKEMAKEDAPKGDQADWKKKVEALVSAAQRVVSGDKEAIAKLKAASDCKACHSLHKP
jgi:hypothetical protein